MNSLNLQEEINAQRFVPSDIELKELHDKITLYFDSLGFPTINYSWRVEETLNEYSRVGSSLRGTEIYPETLQQLWEDTRNNLSQIIVECDKFEKHLTTELDVDGLSFAQVIRKKDQIIFGQSLILLIVIILASTHHLKGLFGVFFNNQIVKLIFAILTVLELAFLGFYISTLQADFLSDRTRKTAKWLHHMYFGAVTTIILSILAAIIINLL